jgi:cellulose synthase/poly-beta-1,6-N-acetylglucosamine synthase-like glycosyltransferase
MSDPGDRPSQPIRPGLVSVVVTVLRDPRVARAIESLLAQERRPDEILIDDGGGPGKVREIAEYYARQHPSVRYLDAPGNIPESRNAALRSATGEFIAFLDADEVAPPGWLRSLTAPFSDPRVGFTGGPTPGMPGTARTIGARYYDGYLRRFYDRVARSRPHALPMGNSAWRAAVFRSVGLLDTSLFRQAASEDQEIAARALAAGWQGAYVPDAWVAHDFSDLTLPRLLHKQRVYAEGGYVVWRRRGSTYEASAGRLAPYVGLPLIVVAGAILLAPGLTRVLGEILVGVGLIGLGLLAVGLTVSGLLEDKAYPGMRWKLLEIPRRWATLYGALRGLVHYGWSGRRAPPPELRAPAAKP